MSDANTMIGGVIMCPYCGRVMSISKGCKFCTEDFLNKLKEITVGDISVPDQRVLNIFRDGRCCTLDTLTSGSSTLCEISKERLDSFVERGLLETDGTYYWEKGETVSDIQHYPSCYDVGAKCTCNLEQRLRDEIKRLKDAIRKYRRSLMTVQDDLDLFAVLDD